MEAGVIVPILLFLLTVINGLGTFIIIAMNKKISTLCRENREEHDELFTARREMEKDIAKIKQTHKVRGCEHPLLEE